MHGFQCISDFFSDISVFQGSNGLLKISIVFQRFEWFSEVIRDFPKVLLFSRYEWFTKVSVFPEALIVSKDDFQKEISTLRKVSVFIL